MSQRNINEKETSNQISLKEILINKFQTVKAARDAANRKKDELQTKVTEEQFFLFFGRKPDSVSGTRAAFDDVTVIYNCSYGGGWQVASNCSGCGVQMTSGNCQAPEEVGEQIVKTDRRCYNCKAKADNSVISPDDALLDALKDFMRENCNCD